MQEIDAATVEIDRIGVSDCDDCHYNTGADITVTVKNAEGECCGGGVEVELTLSSLTHGRFSGTDNPIPVTVKTVTRGVR